MNTQESSTHRNNSELSNTNIESQTQSQALAEPTLSDQQKHLLSRLDMLLPAVEDIHNTLERKLQFNFGLMTSIATILVVGKISWFDQTKLESDETGSFVVFVVCFVIVAACSLWAHWPRERLITPVTACWDSLSKWWDYDPEDYAEQVLLSYESIWNDDRKTRQCKAKLTVISHIAVVVGLLAAFYQSAVSFGLIGVG